MEGLPGSVARKEKLTDVPSSTCPLDGERVNMKAGGSKEEKNTESIISVKFQIFLKQNNAHVPSCKDDHEHDYFGNKKYIKYLVKDIDVLSCAIFDKAQKINYKSSKNIQNSLKSYLKSGKVQPKIPIKLN